MIGSVDDLREAIRAIPHTKSYIETLQTNEAVTRILADRASRFLRIVLDRQSELLSTNLDYDDDATYTESWRPEPKISEEHIMVYVHQDSIGGFSEFIAAITDISVLEEIDFVIEFRVIPKFVARIDDYRQRILRFKNQAVGVLEAAETQSVILLQRFAETESALMRSIVARQKKIEKVSAIVGRNKRIVDEIGAPILPAIRTGFTLSPRFSETSQNGSWQAAIDRALENPDYMDSHPADRVKAIIRKLPMNQHNEARKYVEKKLVKFHELEIEKLHESIAEKQSALRQLSIDQTICLGIYTSIVVDQTWFAQIHY